MDAKRGGGAGLVGGAPATPVTAPAAQPSASPRWSGRSRGGYWGNWFFIQLVKRLGLRWAYAWLVFVAAYFTLVNRAAYRSSAEFLGRVLGPCGGWRRPFRVYRHFLSFGVTLLDRLAVISGKAPIECQFEGESQFREYLGRGKGIILVGAHVGSWEIGGHLLGRLGTPVNVVVLDKDEARLRHLYNDALETRTFRFLTTDGHPLRSIAIAAAVRRGEIVALLGDRTFGGSDCAVDFLGAAARFPTGPYLLAAATGAPIFQVFAVRERLGRYRFFSFPAELVDRAVLRGGEPAVAPRVALYAQRLAEVARQYPYQWHNYYPFWESGPGAMTSAGSTDDRLADSAHR
jgi:predicted LPLAT superfamily acyltransferase